MKSANQDMNFQMQSPQPLGHASRKGQLPPTAGDTTLNLMNNFRKTQVD